MAPNGETIHKSQWHFNARLLKSDNFKSCISGAIARFQQLIPEASSPDDVYFKWYGQLKYKLKALCRRSSIGRSRNLHRQKLDLQQEIIDLESQEQSLETVAQIKLKFRELTCIKDAQLFAAWISSSKAEQKEIILKRLKKEMDIDKLEEPNSDDEASNDFNDVDMAQEGKKLENLKIENDNNKISCAVAVNNYSDAEFRSVVIEELLSLRKKLVEVIEENKALRQENAVLEKYRPNLIDLPPNKLPMS